jgi:DNA-binding NarL/FixJ family response regulator
LQTLKIYHIGLCANNGTNNGLQRAFRKVSQYKEIHTSHRDLNNQIVKDVIDFKPDIVFMQIQTPNIIHLDTILKIKDHCGKIVNFTGDVRYPLPNWYIEIGKHIFCTLFVSMDDVSMAISKGINAEWIQIGFDETIFNDSVTPIKSADIIFNANNYDHFPLSKYRKEIAHALHREFKDRFQLYGSGWTIPSLDTNASMEKQASTLRGCKIAISCSNLNHSMYISDRVLKYMGAGAMVMSHNFKDYSKLYVDGKNIGIFDSIDDMIEQCHYYLKNEDERLAIAKEGYNLTHKMYTWDCMIKNLLEICE